MEDSVSSTLFGFEEDVGGSIFPRQTLYRE